MGRAGTAEHVERIVQGWRQVDRRAEARKAVRQHDGRGLRVYEDAEGMVVVRGRLTPEAGALLRRALEAGREALYQQARTDPGAGTGAETCRRHHRAVHEEGYQAARGPDGTLQFRRPDGRPLPEVPAARQCDGDPVALLRARHALQSLRLGPHTAHPGWLGERLDVGWAIDVLHPRANPSCRGA